MSEELKPPQFPTMLRKMWSGSEVQAWIDDNWNRRAQPEPAAPAGVTVLPDGSAFATASWPLPKNHWLYAPRGAWDNERDAFAETPRPILTNAQCEAVIAASRYAIRGATMCGQEQDFDPDALVQNICYALCGPANGSVLPADAAPSVAPVAVALTDTFVQPVPDRCDRITWRGRYYHLPIAHPPRAPLTPEQVFADTNIMACNAKMALRMDVLMEIIRAVEAAHDISAAAIGAAK